MKYGIVQRYKESGTSVRAGNRRLGDPKLSEDVLARYRTVVERGTGYVLADFPQLEEGTHIRVLFDSLSYAVMTLDAGVTREILKLYVAFKAETNFVDVVPQKSLTFITKYAIP